MDPSTHKRANREKIFVVKKSALQRDAKKHAVFVEPVNYYGMNKDTHFQLTFYLFVTFSKFRHFNNKSCCAKAKIKLYLL